MAIPKSETERYIYFAGLLTELQAVVDVPYLKFMKGRPLPPATTETINYRSIATKNLEASLLGFRKIEGQTLRQPGFDDFKITPGIIAQSELITADDAKDIKANDVIYTTKNQITAEENIYRDKAYSIKAAIELRKNIMVAQLIHEGKYTSCEGRTVEFPIRPIDTMDYTAHGKFLLEYKKQLRAFVKVNGKRPDSVIVGEKIVDELLKDKIFMEEVYKLGLAGFKEDDKNIVVAKVLGTQLEEEMPAYDPDLEVDSAKGDTITLLNTERLHDAYAGLAVLVGKTPKIIASQYVAYEDIDTKNHSVEFIGKSAYTPILSDPNAIWRVQVNLPTVQQNETASFSLNNNDNGLPKNEEELSEVINTAVETALKKYIENEKNKDSIQAEETKLKTEDSDETPIVTTGKGKGKEK